MPASESLVDRERAGEAAAADEEDVHFSAEKQGGVRLDRVIPLEGLVFLQ